MQDRVGHVTQVYEERLGKLIKHSICDLRWTQQLLKYYGITVGFASG